MRCVQICLLTYPDTYYKLSKLHYIKCFPISLVTQIIPFLGTSVAKLVTTSVVTDSESTTESADFSRSPSEFESEDFLQPEITLSGGRPVTCSWSSSSGCNTSASVTVTVCSINLRSLI